MGPSDRLQRGAGAVTSTDWFEIVLIVLLIAAVGVLGASEVAITRANRVRAYRLLEEKRTVEVQPGDRITVEVARPNRPGVPGEIVPREYKEPSP